MDYPMPRGNSRTLRLCLAQAEDDLGPAWNQPSAPSSDLELTVTTVVTTTTPETAPLSSQWRHGRYQFGLRKYRMLAPTTVVIWLASTSPESAASSGISDASRRSGPSRAPDRDRNSRQLAFSGTVAAAVQPAPSHCG
jgi:hypothetical protein